MKKQKGFTLIELVVVIAVLGILAAFALPRFVDFTGNANTAARAGFVGSLSSAVGLAKAKYVAQGNTGTVTLDGGTAITMNAQGYPDVAVTYNSVATCQTLINNLLQNPSGVVFSYNPFFGCTINKAGVGGWGTNSDIILAPTGVVN